jgi:hypothetical protein
MSKTIKTYDDLCAERDRLKGVHAVQKQRIKDNWETMKNEFGPVKSVFGFIGKLTHPDKSHPIMNMGLKMATDIFITKFVLGKGGWITKIAVPFVVRNYSSHMFADKGKKLLVKIGTLLKRNRHAEGNGVQ